MMIIAGYEEGNKKHLGKIYIVTANKPREAADSVSVLFSQPV